MKGKLLNILSVNCQGLRDRKKRLKLYKWSRDLNMHVLFLQETHFSSDITDIHDKYDWFGRSYHSFGTTKSCGVSILIRNRVIEVLNYTSFDNGRSIGVRISYGGETLWLINVYAPNNITLRKQFFEKCFDFIDENVLPGEGVIFGGDFNTVLNYKLDKEGGILKDFHDAVYLRTQFGMREFVDIWRDRHTNNKEFSHKQTCHGLVKTRIDFFMISNWLKDYVNETEILGRFISDHNPIVLKVEFKHAKIGKGLWKLNNTLLQDEEYKQKVTDLIEGLKKNMQEKDIDIRDRWDLFKKDIKEMSIRFSVEKANCFKNNLLTLQCRLDQLEKINDPTDQQIRELHSLRKDLNDLYAHKVQGTLLRSKIKWYEQGERNNKYFLGLEKQNYQQKNLFKVEYENKIYRTSEEILNAEVQYFSNLYSESETENEEYFKNVTFEKVLDEEQKKMCDDKLDIQECTRAVKDAKQSKSPGPDGITFEFYKCFWSHLQDILLDVFNYALSQGKLSTSQGRAAITLIHKKGRKDILSNWRPISLLNTDYKIMASALANRLKKVLNTCISTDQNAYLKGRYINNNIRLIYDVISYMQNNKKSGAILFLDLEKAFDKVNRAFLYKALEKFNFGKQFIEYIKALYANGQSCVINNNWQSSYFDLKRGLRQGCPVSALLFLIVIEVLANDLKKNRQIKGIDLADDNTVPTEVKISQFADDTTVFVEDEQSLHNILKRVCVFSEVAGPTLNTYKSKGFAFGNFDASQFKDIDWTSEFVKTLGVYFSKNVNRAYEKTWTEKTEKMECQLKQWKCRNLTYFGKVIILKSLVISNITYIMSALPTFKFINKIIEKLIYSFIWKGKDKIKRRTIIGRTDKGGLNMPDFLLQSYALKTSWLHRLLHDQNENALWKILPNIYLNSFGPKMLVLKMSFKNERELKELNKIPLFYRQCIMAWKQCIETCQVNEKAEDIRQQILWGNHNIVKKNSCLFWRHWISSDLFVIGDIVNEEGKLDIHFIQSKLKKKGNYLCESKLLWSCIPRKWKNVLVEERAPNCKAEESHYVEKNKNPSLGMQTTQVKCKLSRLLYKSLIDKNFVKPGVETYWETFFQKELSWPEIWKDRVTNVKERRLAQFNFKLLYKLHMTNKNLCRFKMTDSSLCYKCDSEENYYHLFYDCIYSQTFWEKFSTFCAKIQPGIDKVEVDFEDIIIGEKETIHCKRKSFQDLLTTLGTYVLFREKKKLNFTKIYEAFIEEIKWRSKNYNSKLWTQYKENILRHCGAM